MADDGTFTLIINDEGDGMLSAQVKELPGCFASGSDMDELMEAAGEAIAMYLEGPQVDDESDNVVEFGRKRPDGRRRHPIPRELVLEA